jgi:hypothetical protein
MRVASRRHVRVFAFCSAVLSAMLVTSCRGSSGEANVSAERDHDGSEATDATVDAVSTFEEFCAADADAYCSMLERCCPAAGVPYEREVCDRRVFHVASAPRAWCGVKESPASFNAATATRCLSLRRQLIAECRFLRADDPLVIEAAQVCEQVAIFTPTETTCDASPCFAPPGMTSRCNVIVDSSAPRMCTPPVPRASLQQPCAGFALECVAGLYCANDSRCAALLPDGSPCSQDYECGSNDCTDWPAPGVELSERVCEPFRAIGWDECGHFNDPRISRPGGH